VPLQIQHVNVTIDGPGFTFNPTNCNPMSIKGAIKSAQGATPYLSSPFQAQTATDFKPSQATALSKTKNHKEKGQAGM